jgi:hypothetical protein
VKDARTTNSLFALHLKTTVRFAKSCTENHCTGAGKEGAAACNQNRLKGGSVVVEID